MGMSGIEKYYDDYLRGKGGGSIIEVDARGRVVKVVEDVIPEEGSDLYLTVEPELQEYSSSLLKDKKGTIIGIDPDSGRILILVSYPAFDPNIFPYDLEKIKEVLNDKNYPLLNRAIQARYSPGSIFKIIVSISGIESGIIDPKEKVNCSGKFFLKGIEFDCWKEEGHGDVDFINGFKHSCNVYFYNMGLKIGAKTISDFANYIGITLKSGIDLPQELKGFVPSPSWKRKEKKYPWLPGDTVNLSIGQGYTLLTPIEVALLGCSIATKGYIYRSFLVEKIVSNDGKVIFENDPEIIHSFELKEKTWKLIYTAMRKVVEEGTARYCNIKGLKIFGKTGTTQNPQGEPHSWFLSFNEGKRRMVLLVFVENGGMGAEAAVPIARRIWKFFKEHFVKDEKV